MRKGILLIGLLALALLAGCGGSDDTPGLTGEGIEITCMDATTAEDSSCQGAQAASLSALAFNSATDTVIYNGGDVGQNEILWV